MKSLHDDSIEIFRKKSTVLRILREKSSAFGFVEHLCPILTINDCEGGGEAFQLDHSEEFFGKKTFLTVSAQLHLEAACAKEPGVYTISPVFRAEKHDSKRHLSEFWMYEAEIAFPENLDALMDKCEQLLRCSIPFVQNVEIPRICYSEAVNILCQNGYDLFLGAPLNNSHEVKLCEIFGAPIFIKNYPTELKAFYFKKKKGDAEFAECFDLLVPKFGEIAGGGLRETDFDVLTKNVESKGIDPLQLDWYLDLRKYGHPPTGGFGIGIERLLLYLTRADNIRDVVHFPRHKGMIKC